MVVVNRVFAVSRPVCHGVARPVGRADDPASHDVVVDNAGRAGWIPGARLVAPAGSIAGSFVVLVVPRASFCVSRRLLP